MKFLQPNAVFDGKQMLADVVLRCEEDIVTDIIPLHTLPVETKAERIDEILTVGLFDVQVNGGGGVMLNNDPTQDAVCRIALAHKSEGTTYTLPTVITDAPEIMRRAADAVSAELGNNGVSGIHIEGPHISLKHKGTHNTDYIRPFDDNTMSILQKLCEAKVPVLLTLAPETVKPGLIAQVTNMGVVVSAGHSAATAEETQRALSEGMRCFTHLFNGMPAMGAREPKITGAAINSDVWCGIIADGHHVSNEMVGLAVRARPRKNRMILVSDAMSTVGGPDQFDLYGETIKVDNGRLVNAIGSLAGAHISLKDSVMNAITKIGISPGEAIRMSTTNPFEMMNISVPEIIGTPVSDLGRIPYLNS